MDNQAYCSLLNPEMPSRQSWDLHDIKIERERERICMYVYACMKEKERDMKKMSCFEI